MQMQDELEKEVLKACVKPCTEQEIYSNIKNKFPDVDKEKLHNVFLSMVYRNIVDVTPDWKYQKARLANSPLL